MKQNFVLWNDILFLQTKKSYFGLFNLFHETKISLGKQNIVSWNKILFLETK